MLEFYEIAPNTEVLESQYKRLLGYPADHLLDGRARELADWARQWYRENGKPWIYARQAEIFSVRNSTLVIDGVAFNSKELCTLFSDSHAQTVMLAAVSAGKECEEKARQLWLEGKPDEYFFLEVYGSAVVECLITFAGARFCAWADQQEMVVLPHYSPGYSEWSIDDQVKLLRLVTDKSGCPIKSQLAALSTGMLQPKKSLLAVFGITNDSDNHRNLVHHIPCESCSLPGCQYRRKPYQRIRQKMEDVRAMQPVAPEPANGVSFGSSLILNAKYSVSARTLRKWASERLQLEAVSDSVTAKFRYEGTTCSNMGHSLEYEYVVQLSSPAEGYRIQELSCKPVAGSTGYQQMCGYIQDSARLEREIAHEKPLIGRPLNDILKWKRLSNPAACFCEASAREHKWGLVFEVLHFALVQHEQKAKTEQSQFEEYR